MTKHSEGQTASQAVPLHVRRSGKLLLWGGYVMPLMLYSIVLSIAPLDVLDRFVCLKNLSDGTREVARSLLGWDIYRHAASTSFSQVAMLMSALAMLTVLYMALAAIVRTTVHFRYVAPLLRDVVATAKSRFGGLILLPAFGLLALWAVFCLPGEWSFAAGLTTQSRAGYLSITLPTVALAGVGIGMWFSQLRLLLADLLSSKD